MMLPPRKSPIRNKWNLSGNGKKYIAAALKNKGLLQFFDKPSTSHNSHIVWLFLLILCRWLQLFYEIAIRIFFGISVTDSVYACCFAYQKYLHIMEALYILFTEKRRYDRRNCRTQKYNLPNNLK